MNLNHGVCITDKFMNDMLSGNKENRDLWIEILKTRFETGEPYLFFSDNVNNQLPGCYKKNNLKVYTSNLCSEIFLHTDPEHSFVCCLSSLNLTKYDEWKNTDIIELTTWFLDAVIEEYLEKSDGVEGLECSRRFAIKSRALGIGVLGWHTYLQQNKIPFDSFEAMRLNAEIFRKIQHDSQKASRDLAKEYGEPEWCKGFGIRNSHTMAVAPTVSNSIISGGMSASIEPIPANIFALKSAKGTFFRYNPVLSKLLDEKGKNIPDVWKQINADDGSVQNLSFLSESEKEIFLTAREINQFAIIRQAAQRQKWIDQGQSVNLFFAKNSDPKYIHDIHVEAWRSGLKSLYYCRSESVLKGDSSSRQADECKACES
jgi:ribonucleoside-diphosphate reductase alpha chain